MLPKQPLEWVPLARYSSMGVGGPARYLVTAERPEAIETWASWAEERQLPWLVLGHGSNVIIGDSGYDGLVIVNSRPATEGGLLERRQADTEEHVALEADAGKSLSSLSRWAMLRGLSGLEWAYGVPGTLGGAVMGNAGAFGGCIGDVIQGADVLVGGVGRRRYSKEQLRFGYRTCGLSEHSGPIAILWLELRLHQQTPEVCGDRGARMLAERRRRQPVGRSAGCVFRNPEGVSAGALIDACGLKGCAVGDAVVSVKHANFILNRGNATAEDVVRLMSLMRRRVAEEYGIVLQPEVRFVGQLELEDL